MITANIIPYQLATKQLTTTRKAGQLFMPAAFINDSEAQIQKLEKLIRDHFIGGICFFHSRASAATNFEGRQKVVYNKDSLQTLKDLIKRYQQAALYPLLIAIDAEWGLAMRVENTPQYPYAVTLGAIRDKGESVQKVGRQIAFDLRAAGIHWNFAPVADINNNPLNPVIGYRSFGEDKQLVSQLVIAYIRGQQEMGILSCAKHYPGHGDTATDSHLGLPLIAKSREELENNELFPFREAINHGVDSIMVGHLAVPALTGEQDLPTSVSGKAITDILRKDMGFTGVVVSDALNMRAISDRYPSNGELEWQAFDAGNDVLCFAEHNAEGIQKILKNSSEGQVERSFKRVWKLKEKALAVIHSGLPTSPGSAADLNRDLAAASLTLYQGEASIFGQWHREPLTGIEISRTGEQAFFRNIQKSCTLKVHSTADASLEAIAEEVKSERRFVLAVYPPKVKPHHNFEMSDEEIHFINTLILGKDVILYIFGNPYLLNLIKVQKARAVVIAYQDFQVFQEHAALHFLGKTSAIGVLPVTIGNQDV